MRLLWYSRAWDEYLYWQAQDKKTLKRINALVRDIQRGQAEDIGKPEKLKGNLNGWQSRRIDAVNRLVYKLVGDALIIAACKGPYGE